VTALFQGSKRSDSLAAAGRAVLVILFLGLLELSVASGWISPLFVSRPSATMRAFAGMAAEGSLWEIAGTTLFMVVVTFVSGASIGLPLGYVLWRCASFGRACEPILGSLFASPLILLYPIFLVLFGRTLTAIIVQALIVGIIPIILGTHNGLKQVSRTFIDVGSVLQLTRWQLFRHVLLPASAPLVFTGLRLGFIYMLLSIIAMEYVVALGGIGNMISGAYFRLDTDELYVGLFLVIFFSVFFFRALLRGQRWVGTA
jgi:ABC-type nitrate/sulfonate/bicarbonate transport system permease component